MASHSITENSRARKMVIFRKMGWMTVGEILAERRKELKMTLEAVASHASTHKGYICGIEQGTLNPPAPNALTLICKALRLDPDPILIRSWVEKSPIAVLPKVIGVFSTAVPSRRVAEA